MIDLAPSGAEDALDDLVNQFADPLAFLRELVQNSIDAGSAQVEVRCDFEAPARPAGPPRPGESAEEPTGTLIIRLADWGCGMDRQVIDHKLTRLFSSDKEGDRTKIGKFGIGFVSVFALRPDAVCVDTGRADRLCARSPHGDLMTLEACQTAADTDWLFVADQPSPLSRQISDNGMVVLQSWQGELARALYNGSEPPAPARSSCNPGALALTSP